VEKKGRSLTTTTEEEETFVLIPLKVKEEKKSLE